MESSFSVVIAALSLVYAALRKPNAALGNAVSTQQEAEENQANAVARSKRQDGTTSGCTFDSNGRTETCVIPYCTFSPWFLTRDFTNQRLATALWLSSAASGRAQALVCSFLWGTRYYLKYYKVDWEKYIKEDWNVCTKNYTNGRGIVGWDENTYKYPKDYSGPEYHALEAQDAKGLFYFTQAAVYDSYYGQTDFIINPNDGSTATPLDIHGVTALICMQLLEMPPEYCDCRVEYNGVFLPAEFRVKPNRFTV